MTIIPPSKHISLKTQVMEFTKFKSFFKPIHTRLWPWSSSLLIRKKNFIKIPRTKPWHISLPFQLSHGSPCFLFLLSVNVRLTIHPCKSSFVTIILCNLHINM
uniref:Uncharacterized protein n=1 Tax=Arundo donax TaxID=35708 RepID=A0A0A8Y694_ARUDO